MRSTAPNPSVERTPNGQLRCLSVAAQVERWAPPSWLQRTRPVWPDRVSTRAPRGRPAAPAPRRRPASLDGGSLRKGPR